MIYDVQYNYPIANAAPMIYEELVDAGRPIQPIPQALAEIQKLLAQGSPVYHRAFLERLADEIELHNTNVIRSGRPAPQSGQWLCYEDYEDYEKRASSAILAKGEIAPANRPGGNVWVLAPKNPNPTPRERVLFDFSENFIPRALCAIRDQDPEDYAEAACKRLSYGLDGKGLADLSAVLEHLIQSPASPLLDEIKSASGFDWTEDEVRWTFLQKYARGVIRRLGRKKNAWKKFG
ncbi:MAG: hypothetical protein J2P31_09760 [Blastocatellia bacterium]|nr:hypothetical protein [Blastocatellia bacterium]